MKPGWLPFSIVLAILALLAAVPFALKALATERPERAVGVYERVSMGIESDGPFTLGGFIAPEGWVHVDDADDSAEADQPSDDDDEMPTHVALSTVSGDTSLVASLHIHNGDAESLLRETAPTGAQLAPVRAVDGLPGHETFLLEYDLAAGAGLTQKFAACADAHTEGGPRTCMLIDVEMAGDDRTSGIVRQDIAEVLKTGEVY